MTKKWHHYEAWESYKYGMYSALDDMHRTLKKPLVLALMKETSLFGRAMERVVHEWQNCTEHNLTCTASNRRAWIGQAACAIELGSSEDLTRECWGEMNYLEQYRANKIADRVISRWENLYARGHLQIHFYMGIEGLRVGNTGRSGPKARGAGAGAIVPFDLQSNFEERCGAQVLGFYKKENTGLRIIEANRDQREARP